MKHVYNYINWWPRIKSMVCLVTVFLRPSVCRYVEKGRSSWCSAETKLFSPQKQFFRLHWWKVGASNEQGFIATKIIFMKDAVEVMEWYWMRPLESLMGYTRIAKSSLALKPYCGKLCWYHSRLCVSQLYKHPSRRASTSGWLGLNADVQIV